MSNQVSNHVQPKPLEEAIREALKEINTKFPKANILITGATGVGKSTLINAVFQQKLAKVGQGRPVTQETEEFTCDGVPTSIFDTKGLELADYQAIIDNLYKFIDERSKLEDYTQHIHIGWICIQEDSRRVEQAIIDLHDRLSKKLNIIVVITKARDDKGFQVEVEKLLPNAKAVIRVRAEEEVLTNEDEDEPLILKKMGLKKLIETTSEHVPDGIKASIAAAQIVSINLKKKEAQKYVNTAAAAALAAGASPIPFSDAALLVPIQITMLAGISKVFGFGASKATLATLASSIIGVSGATYVGKTIVTNLLKFVPGVGTGLGAAISGGVASTLTKGLGTAYVEVLAQFFLEDPEADPSAEDLVKGLKEKMSN